MECEGIMFNVSVCCGVCCRVRCLGSWCALQTYASDRYSGYLVLWQLGPALCVWGVECDDWPGLSIWVLALSCACPWLRLMHVACCCCNVYASC